KGAGVGQGGSGHQLSEVGALLQAFDQQRQQFVGGGLLHQADKRFELAEGEYFGLVCGVGQAKTEGAGEGRADAGDDHALADVGEKVTACSVHVFPPVRDSRERGGSRLVPSCASLRRVRWNYSKATAHTTGVQRKRSVTAAHPRRYTGERCSPV